ncbi:DNA-directed RNA polymerase subunit delta [Candidatus Malacoplasma girerdii]|uniref:RNAP delta factor n=1 Tax=Candidatus Malacoplasma girerdii TaxID=1318617 RepID=A0A097SSW8_9BACT|nr:DNA-directed RNA polymerase subunit delta [Candidatus Malacoplasma girerdii]ASJ89225.1 MAG: putative DNA-directed RNA polymerase subunit delta [Candidatus Malacoplasma girerdii]
MSRLLIDVAYDIAKQNFKKEQFSFESLWDLVTKKMRYSQEQIESEIGEFYSDIMQDSRFIFCGRNHWRLSEYLKLDEKHNMQNMLYDLNQEICEEGYDKVNEKPTLNDDEEELDEQDIEINEENATEFEINDEEEATYENVGKLLKSSNDKTVDGDEEE